MDSQNRTPGDQIIESVIQDYLRRNPGMRREDILVQTIGGRLVIRSIKKAFAAIPRSVQQKQFASPQLQKFLDEIARSGNERLLICLESLQKCKEYSAWILQPCFQTSDETASRKSFINLEELERKSHQSACDIQNLKDKFSETINGGIKPSPSLIQTWVQEYMQSILAQIKCQRSIYQNELNLGNQFESCVKRFMSERIPAQSGKPDPAFIKILAKAIIILKNSGIETLEVGDGSDIKAMDQALSAFRDRLRTRWRALEELNQLIAHIEAFIEHMHSASTSQEPEKKDDNKSSQRMVFHDSLREKK